MEQFHLPGEPFKRILDSKIEEGWTATDLANRLNCTPRKLHNIMNEGMGAAFDTADQIVTLLLGPMAWHEDAELNEIYRSVNLRKIDWAYPVSDGVRKKLSEVARSEIKKRGTLRAARNIGISSAALSRLARA